MGFENMPVELGGTLNGIKFLLELLGSPRLIQRVEIPIVKVTLYRGFFEENISPVEGVPRKQTSRAQTINLASIEIYVRAAGNEDASDQYDGYQGNLCHQYP